MTKKTTVYVLVRSMWLDDETHWEIPYRVYTNWEYAKKLAARLNRMSRGKKDADGFIYSYNVSYSELIS